MSQPTQRLYSDINDDYAKSLLNQLLIKNISTEDYQQAMLNLGRHLGSTLQKTLDLEKKYCIVSTAEDADYLTKGIVEKLGVIPNNVFFACFWNRRSKVNGTSIAPIYNKFLEPGYQNADELIVVKSIIMGSCVVKTNITALFEDVNPSAVHIVSPVMHKQSSKKLKIEFPDRISKTFDFTVLATDTDESDDGDLIPGVGGSVYQRLGFKNQDDKNTFFPNIIKQKMAMSV